MNNTIVIILMVVITVLLIIVEHYFPWRAIFMQPMPVPIAYVLGTLAIILPGSAATVLVDLSSWRLVGVWWIITVAAGSTTLICRCFDDYMKARGLYGIAKKEGEILRSDRGGDRDGETNQKR